MIRAMLTASALLLAGGGWLHLDALKRARAAGRRAGQAESCVEAWNSGASHVCKEQIAQGREYGIKDGVCLVKIGGRWVKPPGLIRGEK